MKARPSTLLCRLLLSLVLVLPAASKAAAAALDTPEGGLESLIRMRGSTDGRQVYADWRITAWAVIPGERSRPLFRIDGFNTARMERQANGGWRMLSREVGYYRDLQTGEILNQFNNPLTGQVNEVLHVINDPVNIDLPPAGPGRRRVDMVPQGADMVIRQNVPLLYPNPITPQEYPQESTGPIYSASEHFTYYAKRVDLESSMPSVPTHYAWTRLGPWLPWMKMGQRPGFLLYIGHGAKIERAEDLDPFIRAYAEKHHPDFMTAPKVWSQPNETSWTWYRKQRPPVKP